MNFNQKASFFAFFYLYLIITMNCCTYIYTLSHTMMIGATSYDTMEEIGLDEISIDLHKKDDDPPRMNRNINPFAVRDGKTLSWRSVNMTVVSIRWVL